MVEENMLNRLTDRIEVLSGEIEKASTFAQTHGYDKVDDELLARTVKQGEALTVLANALSSHIKSYERYGFFKKRETYKSVKKAFHYASLSMIFNASTYLARNNAK
jgi:hypothetical protein